MSTQLAPSPRISLHSVKLGRLKCLASRRFRWVFLSLLTSLLSLLLVKAVEAKVAQHIDQGALDFGRSLALAFEQLHPSGTSTRPGHSSEVYRLTANGISVLMQSAHITAESEELDEVFTTFAARCRQPLEAKTPKTSDQVPLFSAPLIEARGAKESYLYCLRPNRPTNAEGISAALSEFSSDQDLTALGRFQGIYLRSEGDHHQLLIMETQGPALLKRAFERHQDAPGSDMEELPRPAGRRSLSLLYSDKPHFNYYVMDESSEEVLAHYAEQLRASGISLLSPSSHASKRKSLIARTERDTFLIVVHKRNSRDHHSNDRLSSSASEKGPNLGSVLSITRVVR